MRFKNKTALITGAAVGIGKGVAIKLASEGAKLVLMDVNEEKLELLKKEIEQYTTDYVTVCCDISDEQKVWDSFVNTSTQEWRDFLDVNVMGTVYVTKAVLPDMIEKNYGRIVNVASIAGVYGNANMVHYSATKGAVIAMTRSLAKEVADKVIGEMQCL